MPSPNPLPPTPRPSAQRIGLFGGSFDPVHNGHLLLAECCRDQAGLDLVLFVPTALQPHKPHGPRAGDDDRCEMLRRSFKDTRGMGLSMMEIERGGVSYTVDSLRYRKACHPEDENFLLMGADTLHDLPLWREPAEVLRLATPVVVHRPGEPAPDFGVLSALVDEDRLEEIASLAVEMPPTDISSSGLRRRVAGGESIDGMTPPGVVEWIATRGLYREG